MRFSHKTVNLVAAVLAFALAASYLSLIAAPAGRAKRPKRPAATVAQSPLTAQEQTIETREQERKGITVDKPRIYDDALLQQMLQVAEARLATLQVIDQTQLLSRLGATTGASQQISSAAFNVQGVPLPQMVTTSKGRTGTTTETEQLTGTTSGSQTVSPTATTIQSGQTTGDTSTLQTVSGLATQDVTTTRGQFGPPGATAPSPTTTLPSTGFSVSSSDILNEQMQLTAEINGLRLMLAGDLSGHFVKGDAGLGEGVTKLKTTLGFPVTLSPDVRYKDAVAVVEVEVSQPQKRIEIEKGVRADIKEKAEESGEELTNDELERRVKAEADQIMLKVEDPLITALLPREKTYNVASITDKSVSVGGGVATQLLGFSGSWLWGHKTYYLVQDQDTVAKAFKPATESSVGFVWEFRPVLGQRYVKSGLKQTFVQLAFAAPADAVEGEIGQVTIRTYWRKYDRKRGVPKEIIPGSLSVNAPIDIPRISLAARPPAFNSSNLEDLGQGEILVNLKGRFLPGTYVRIGSEIINAMPRLLHEYAGIRFSAAIADLATKDVFLVAHDGTEVPLKFRGCGIEEDRNPAGMVIGNTTTKFIPDGDPTITTVDDTNSLVKVKFLIQKTVRRAGVAPVVTTESPAMKPLPALVLIVGSRVFGYSDLKRNRNELSALVPTAALSASPELSIQTLFPKRGCRPDVLPIASFIPPRAERLVVLEHRETETKFLLFGSRLGTVQVLSPAGVRLEMIGPPSEAEKMRSLILTADQLNTNKQLLLQRGDERPFLVTIPEVEPRKPDPPKAKERVPINADEAVFEGDGMNELESVTFRRKKVEFDVVDERSVRLKGLSALGATSFATTQRFDFKFKSEAKAKKVELEVVNTKVETLTK